MDKFGLLEGIFDAIECIKKEKKGYIRLTLFTYIICLIPGIMYDFFIGNSILHHYVSHGFSRGLWITLILLFLLLVFLKGLFIKLTDDVIERRDFNLKEQMGFIVNRYGKILLSSIIVAIPTITMMVIVSGRKSNDESTLIINLVILAYTCFVVMISQGIIMEDLGVISTIKRSFSIMGRNYFKFLCLLSIGYFVTIMVQTVLRDSGLILQVIKLAIDCIIGVYLLIFTSSLFKQVSDTPRW